MPFTLPQKGWGILLLLGRPGAWVQVLEGSTLHRCIHVYMCVCVDRYTDILVNFHPSQTEREAGWGCWCCLHLLSALSVFLWSVWPATYICKYVVYMVYICALCVCVPARSASSALLFVGPVGMEQQQQPSWGPGSDVTYFLLTDSASVSNEHAQSAVYWPGVCYSWTDLCCSAQGDQCAQHCSLTRGRPTSRLVSVISTDLPRAGCQGPTQAAPWVDKVDKGWKLSAKSDLHWPRSADLGLSIDASQSTRYVSEEPYASTRQLSCAS